MRASSKLGNPRCQACEGRGGWQGPRGWIKCACVVGNADQRKAQQQANGDSAKYPDRDAVKRQLSMLDQEGKQNA